jgi:hypothetical protein
MVMFGIFTISASAVQDGTTLTMAPPWTALVTQNATILGHNYESTSECSGTLIATDWVLTAAHCLYNESGVEVATSTLRVVLERNEINPDDGSGIQYTVNRADIYSGYPSTDDVALLKLNEKSNSPLPTGAAPMPLAPVGLQIGSDTPVTAYGYGLTYQAINTKTGAPIYMDSTYASYLGETAYESYLAAPSCDTGDYLCLTYNGPSQITHGDSGGPEVIDLNNPALLAVNDRYYGNFEVTGTDQGYFANFLSTSVTDKAIHSWIDTTAGIVTPSVNRIIKDKEGNAYLVGDDRFIHSIPDTSTYYCLTKLGDVISTVPQAEIQEQPLSDAPASCGSNLFNGQVIFTSAVGLGVNPTGELNVSVAAPSSEPGTNSDGTYYGLRYLANNDDSVGPNVPGEGWGVADSESGTDGYADQYTGTAGLTVTSFTYTPDSATSVVTVGGNLEVTNAYSPSRTPDLVKDAVTITNVSTSTLADVVYRRLVDWDMEPTAFDEYVTNEGFGNSPHLVSDTNDGFDSADPLSASDDRGATGNFEMYGPLDQGTQFNFSFGSLGAGRSLKFMEYYGMVASAAQAASDLDSVGVEAYSLGEPSLDLTGDPNTAILAFSGIGGSPLTVTVPAIPTVKSSGHIGDSIAPNLANVGR